MKNLVRYSFFCLCLAGFCAVSAAQSAIEEVLKKEKAMWGMTPQSLTELFPGKNLFQWADVSKTEFRYSADSGPGKLTFAGLPVDEAIFIFKNDKLSKICLSPLSRKDTATAHDELLKKLNDALEGLTGKKADGEPLSITGGKKSYSRNWHCKDYFIELKWSSGKTLQAESFSLNISPPLKSADGRNSKKSLAEKVKGNNEGDRYLEVPIPGQEQGGDDFVAAVATQLLNYYGLKADPKLQEKLSAAPGNNGFADIEKVIRSCAAATGFKYSKLYLNNDMSNMQNFDRMVKLYNTEARKSKVQILSLQKYMKVSEMRTAYSLSGIVSAMDPGVYKKIRLKDNINFKKFQKEVIENIDSGIPVIWAAKLGIIKEENIPQQYAIILRLISGYNEKEDKVVYTDYWDEAHPQKKMSWEDAWAVTFFTGLLTPKMER